MNWYKSNKEMMYNGGQFAGYYPYNMGYYYPNMNVVMNSNMNAIGNERTFQFKQVQREKTEEDGDGDEKQKYMNEVALNIIEHIERLKEELKVLKNNNNGTMLNNNNHMNVNVNKTNDVISKYGNTLSPVEDTNTFKNMSRLNVKSIDNKYTNNVMKNKPTKNLK
jgi:alpha-galactosidase/6-phospho-beta-glucosidase family protein